MRLERYFFPIQELSANPKHQPDGVLNGSNIISQHIAYPLEERNDAFGVEFSISLDAQNSVNPPYNFHLSIFGVFVKDTPGDPAPSPREVQIALDLLIGATRERLADLTSRAPWGPFYFQPFIIALEAAPAAKTTH